MEDLKQKLLRARLEKARRLNEKVKADAHAAKPSQLEAGLRGVGQGLTFGLSDEIVGAAEGAWDAATTDKPLMDAYRENRDESRAANDLSQAAHPGTFKTGEIGASVATSFVPGLGVLNAAKGAKLGATVGKAALQGGLAGFGTSEADVTKGELPAALIDTAEGAALSAGTAGLGYGVGKAVAPNALRSVAERRAFKAATGNQGKFYDEAVQQGRVNEIGRDLLDEGAVKFGSDARSIAKNAASAKDDAWSGMKNIMDKVDDESPGAVDGASIAQKIRAYADEIKGPANGPIVEKLLNQADDFEKMGRISLKESQRLKNLYKFDARDPAAMPIGKEATNRIKGILTEDMENAVASYSRGQSVPQFAEEISTGTGKSSVVQMPGKPDAFLKEASLVQPDDRMAALTEYLEKKGKYGNMAQAGKSAEKLANRQEKNRSISLSDTLMGLGAGISTQNPFVGAAIGGANNQLRKRGSSMIAVGADKAADVLEVLSRAPNGVFGQKYGPILKDAAAKGNKALGVTHALLMKNDPEYLEAYKATLEE